VHFVLKKTLQGEDENHNGAQWRCEKKGKCPECVNHNKTPMHKQGTQTMTTKGSVGNFEKFVVHPV
jgi:hypothetical protein